MPNPFKKKNRNPNIKEEKSKFTDIDLEELDVDSEKTQKDNQRKSLSEIDKTKLIEKDKVGGFTLTVEKFINKFTDGKTVQTAPFQTSYNKILSEKNVSRILYIIRYPEKVRPGFLSHYEDLIANTEAISKESFSIVIESHSFPYKEDFSSRKLLAQKKNTQNLLERTEQEVQEIKEALNNPNVRNYRLNPDDLKYKERTRDIIQRKVDSFEAINAYQNSGGAILREFRFLRVVAKDIKTCDIVFNRLMNILKSEKYTVKEIRKINNFLENFGITSLRRTPDSKKIDYIPTTTPSNISSMGLSSNEGIVRSKTPIVHMGCSLDSNYSVDVSFSETTDAVNIMLLADTGGGKTVFAKLMTMYALYNYYIDIMDYKGNEWTYLAKLVKGSKIISLGSEDPQFINTMVIPDNKIFGFSDPKTTYSICFNATVKQLMTLVGVNDKQKSERIESYCKDIVQKAYLKNQVIQDDIFSYENSKDIDFRKSIWEAILELSSDKNFEKRHSQEIIQISKTSLEDYFSTTGSRNILFKNQVNLQDIVDARLVVYEYGAQSVGDNASTPEKEIYLKAFQQEFVVSLRTAKRKKDGEFLIEMIEEVQRLITNPLYANLMNHKATGGRSSNKINIFLLNTIKPLLESKENLDIGAIKENINGLIIGRMKTEAVNEVIDYFGLNWVEDEIKKVAANQNRYKRSFFLNLEFLENPIRTITRAVIPIDYVESPIFGSRDVKVEVNEEELFM